MSECKFKPKLNHKSLNFANQKKGHDEKDHNAKYE